MDPKRKIQNSTRSQSKFVGGSSSRLVLGIDEHLHTNNQLTIGVSFGIQTNESKEIQNSFTVHSAKKEKDRSANAAVIHHRSLSNETSQSLTRMNFLRDPFVLSKMKRRYLYHHSDDVLFGIGSYCVAPKTMDLVEW